MPSSSTEPRIAMATWLKDKAGGISSLEREAEKALYENGDRATHRARLVQKAQLLAAIKDDAAPLLAKLLEPLRGVMESHLAAFSRSAATALSLDSVFYMSALLYPDEHVAGEPTNLDVVIHSLEKNPS